MLLADMTILELIAILFPRCMQILSFEDGSGAHIRASGGRTCGRAGERLGQAGGLG